MRVIETAKTIARIRDSSILCSAAAARTAAAPGRTIVIASCSKANRDSRRNSFTIVSDGCTEI